MVKKLLPLLICLYSILLILGIGKAYGDVNDYSLQNLHKEIAKHKNELTNICADISGILNTLNSSGKAAEFSITNDVGAYCYRSLELLDSVFIMFPIHSLVSNKDDKSMISLIMNMHIAEQANLLDRNAKYINKILTISKNYNVVRTGGRVKDKIVEINEDVRGIRFE